jgi:hypothetical protein
MAPVVSTLVIRWSIFLHLSLPESSDELRKGQEKQTLRFELYRTRYQMVATSDKIFRNITEIKALIIDSLSVRSDATDGNLSLSTLLKDEGRYNILRQKVAQ